MVGLTHSQVKFAERAGVPMPAWQQRDDFRGSRHYLCGIMIHGSFRLIRFLRSGMPLAALVALAGCGPNYSPDTYSTAAVQQANKVERGVVVGVRNVDVSSPGTVGAIAGGAAGGALGAQVPGSTLGATFGAIGGTVLGGLVGTTVEHTTADTTAFEYIVRKPNGDMVSVTQKDKEPLKIGQTVLVIAGSQARIVPDYTKPEPPSATTPAPALAPIVVSPLPAPSTAPLVGAVPSPEKAPEKAPEASPAAAPAAAPAPAITIPSGPVPSGTAPAKPVTPSSLLPSMVPGLAADAAKI